MTARLTVRPASPFTLTFTGELFSGGSYNDPCILDGAHFGDGQHRLIVLKPNDHLELHKTADFETYTAVDEDWMPDVLPTGLWTFQDHVVLADGTFVLYQNDGSNTATAVWTGTGADIDAGTITRQGRVLSEGGDCGVFYEADAGLIHIFPEDPDSPVGTVSASKLTHWTTPDDDLLNATQRADAIETSGWGTGDADFFESDGRYWMWCDYTEDHPTYWVALYRSADLDNWTLIDETFSESTGTRGGDFDTIADGDRFVIFSEYTGANESGVGQWDLTPLAAGAANVASATVSGNRATITVG